MIPRGELLDGRWTVHDPAGLGASGQVYRGCDLDGRSVAIKVFHDADVRVRAREIDRLAAMDLPGVVRYVGHGVCPWGTFVVLGWAEGEHLGETTLDTPRAARVMARLLRALDRLERVMGLIHGDLKPSNVMLGAGDRPVLLDIGGALGRSEGLEFAVVTDAWAAPEVLIDQERPDAAADLYSVALMIWRLRMGRPAFDVEGADAHFRARCRPGPPPCPPGLEDDPLVALLRDMLVRDRAGRPGRDEVLARLAGLALPSAPGLAERVGALADPADAASLFDLFGGSEALFGVRSRAAAYAAAACGGRRDAVVELLSGWVDDGLADWRDGMVYLTHDQLARLEASPEAPAVEAVSASALLREAVIAGGDPLTARAASLVVALAEQGRVEAALEWAERAAEVARREGLPGREMLALAAFDAAMERPGTAVFGVASRIAQRCDAAGVHALARIAMRPDRALETGSVAELGPDDDRALAVRLIRVRAAAAFRLPPDAQRVEVERLTALAPDVPGAGAIIRDAQAQLAYRLGAFVDAADRFRAERAITPGIAAQIRLLLAEAAAATEIPDAPRARACAAEAAREANGHGFVWARVRAELHLRTLAYRDGSALGADLGFVEDVRATGWGYLAGLAAMTEAALAARAGDLGIAYALARFSAEAIGQGAPAGSLLSRGLAVHLRPDPAESAAVLGCVGQLSFPPAVALQIRALAGDRDPAPDLEGLDLDRRREILSLREVRELLVEGRSPFTDRRPQAI